ncbi:small integral membrane protein 35-like [Mobula hypostoma]|uniref:small integral membrane protein 35-like n=1 Tax=Mobula hypostoma TaxID=723540 RepID=UPI002FC33B1B
MDSGSAGVGCFQDGSVNTRGIIIGICLLLLVIVSLAVFFILYYRRGRCFKRSKLKFSQNILRELNSIQLEFDPPFTVSGMMSTMGNHGSDQQFQYHTMRTREVDFSPANE